MEALWILLIPLSWLVVAKETLTKIMKNLILFFTTVMVLGCASTPAPTPTPEPIVNKYGDTAKQAEIRLWITSEVIRITEKKVVVTNMLNAGQIGYEEYFLLMEECAVERSKIPSRARALFLKSERKDK